MHKKLITTCLAIAAFAAFVGAPAASAATLTENGTALAVGTSITATAGETKFTAGSETVICSSAHMSGKVTHNNEDAAHGGTVSGEIPAGNPVFSGTATGGDCTSENLGPVKPTVNSKLCLHIPKGTDFGTVTGCGGAAVTFTLAVTNLGINCRYEKATIEVDITTAANNEDAEVNVVSGQSVPRESNFLCPASGQLDMEFLLTTTGGVGTLTFS